MSETASEATSVEPAEHLEQTRPLGSLGEIKTTPPSEDLSPRLLDVDEIRARHRPRAVLVMWLFELVGALVIATPLHAWAKATWGAHPEGDAPLFRPGGHALVSWLGDEGPMLAMTIRSALVALFVFGLAGQVVTATVIASLSVGRGARALPTPLTASLRAGASCFGSFVLIGLVATALQAVIVGVGLVTATALGGSLHLGDVRAFQVRLIVFGIFAALGVLVGIVADLARVAIAHDAARVFGPDREHGRATPTRTLTRFLDGGRTALRMARTALGRATLAWSWRAALALGLVYVGSVAGDLVGARDGFALLALFGVHQAILVGRAALRTSFFANVLRLESAKGR